MDLAHGGPVIGDTGPMAVGARLAIVVLVAGCSFRSREPAGDGGGGEPDAAVDLRCESWTFTPTEVQPCELPVPQRVALEPGMKYEIDSESGELTGPGGATVTLPYISRNGIGIVSVLGLSVPAGTTLRAKGMLPLAIASWSTIIVAGTVSASSLHPNPLGAPKTFESGAGAGSPQCPMGTDAPQRGTANVAGDGGGGGGGFTAPGGKGGAGGDGVTTGGNGGMSRTRPARIEGGCTGADAAQGADGMPGLGGPGGGAIALIAKDGVTILDGGHVEAGGAGGNGGDTGQTGGGGGGSGGMIKLEARALQIVTGAFVVANGGQGGGGANNGPAGPGVDGRLDGMRATSINKEGGMSTSGGSGGDEGAPAGEPVTLISKDGGGGGGGGGGFIVYKGYDSEKIEDGAILSPSGIRF